jgi:catechol 2,3-dioxygenase-like lactoylglutathione lyase family enzyme
MELDRIAVWILDDDLPAAWAYLELAPKPSGSNRIVLYVDNLDSTIAALKTRATRFRSELEVGPGGRQIVIEDPDGNPIELHEGP